MAYRAGLGSTEYFITSGLVQFTETAQKRKVVELGTAENAVSFVKSKKLRDGNAGLAGKVGMNRNAWLVELIFQADR